jgi:hypothetical protein
VATTRRVGGPGGWTEPAGTLIVMMLAELKLLINVKAPDSLMESQGMLRRAERSSRQRGRRKNSGRQGSEGCAQLLMSTSAASSVLMAGAPVWLKGRVPPLDHARRVCLLARDRPCFSRGYSPVDQVGSVATERRLALLLGRAIARSGRCS